MSLKGFCNWNSFEHQIIFFSKSFHFLSVILDTDTNKLFRKQATPRLESMVTILVVLKLSDLAQDGVTHAKPHISKPEM